MKNFVNGIAFTIAIILAVALISNSVELINCEAIITEASNLHEYHTAVETANACAGKMYVYIGSITILAGVWIIFTTYVREKES